MSKYLFRNPDNYSCSEDELEGFDKDIQTDIMRRWFFEHYEDPVDICPWISKEGGYQYIWGGPHGTDEILFNQFSDTVKEEVIQKLADELNGQCYEWSDKPSNEDYYNEYDDDSYCSSIYSNISSHANVSDSLKVIEHLLSMDIPEGVTPTLHRMIHVHIITLMETYLSDTFINRVMNDKQLLRTFVENHSHFKERKVNLNEIYKKIESIEKETWNYLTRTLWHRLKNVQTLYQRTLKIDFPANMDIISGTI